MRYSSAVLLFQLCTTLYAQNLETPLGTVYDNSLTCENGENPRVTCENASLDDSSCSCKCTNGVNIERPFSFFLHGNGTSAFGDCDAAKQQLEKDAKACATHGEDLTNQLSACTLREKDSAAQLETCAVRDKHSVDQLDACTARANDLVDKLGACTAREKDSLNKLDDCDHRGKDLNDQLEAAKKQAASDARTASELQARITKFEQKSPIYMYKGCYPDNTSARIFNKASKMDDPKMTAQVCSIFCKDYRYFGTQYANQCFCGEELVPAAIDPARCDHRCRGNNLEYCGGGACLSVYENIKI